MRILIADDNNVCRRALLAHVASLGEADLVGTGAKAVAAVQTALEQGRRYGLIFLDIIMPEGDGQDALRQIRSIEAQHGVHGLRGAKVVMTTGIDDRRQVMDAFRGQAEAYLMKPVDPVKLLEVLVDLGVAGRPASP